MATNKKTMKAINKNNLPDTQGLEDTRNLPINKVGIKDILHPMIIKQRSGDNQNTVANFNMYVNLPHNLKGTHMSRFVHILNNHEEHITVETFKSMGAKGTQVAWAEVYGALSTGLVDAAEAPIASIIGAKLYEQKKVISMTGHFKAFVAPMMNAKIFDSMPSDLQQIIMEESINAGKANNAKTVAVKIPHIVKGIRIKVIPRVRACKIVIT